MSRAGKSTPTRTFSLIMLALFGLTALTQAHRQTIAREGTLARADAAGRRTVERGDFARRGSILAAEGEVLAQSEEKFELSLDFRKGPRVPGFALDLANAAGVSVAEIEAGAGSGRRTMAWDIEVGTDRAREIQEVKSRWRADGVSLRRLLRRSYPLKESTSAILGTLGEKGPAGGLELAQNTLLAGRDGERVGLIDRTGAFLPSRMAEDTKEKVEGTTIQLTLRAGLQVATTSFLREAVESNRATSGVAVVIRPENGDIIAMASWPAADPDSGKEVLGFNPNYSSVYEPGSTFKILTLAEALDQGKVLPGAVIRCNGEYHFGRGYRVRCDEHHGSRAHGPVNAEKAIAKSCNIAAAQWSLRVGYKQMTDFIKNLGLLDAPELGVTHERRGLFDRTDAARQLQIANVGFGQSISATPVGLAGAYAMLANDGVRVKPRLIQAINGEPRPVATGARVISASAANQTVRLMEAVIENDIGTGAKLRIPGYRLAGKTGTAQKIGGEASGGYVSSFVGFVPAEKPRAVVLVMVDNPKAGKIYGATVAGPVFRKIAERVIKEFGIPRSD